MQYRKDRSGEDISILGYGCMRFSRAGSGLDYDKAASELKRAVELGVNYFDTAYLYSGSEELLGRFLEESGLRDKVKIATKLPQYLVRTRGQIDRYFDEELRRLRTDRVDYYLMHMVTSLSQWEGLVKLGIEEWIAEKKASGQIRNIGFSYHGGTKGFLEVLAAYDWDFCQIQYNYLDEHTQAGRAGLEAAAARGIPVIIMEPLRGGKLVDLLPEDARSAIAASPRGWSPAELAFRWLWDQPDVTCVLSGMNSIAMVEENCRVADEARAHELKPEDRALVERVVAAINAEVKVGCTGCGYCMPCPKGVDIPATFRFYNQMFTEGKASGRNEYFMTVALRREPAFASQCVGCGACEKHCPQALPIREKLKEADRALRPWYYRVAMKVARPFMLK